MAFPIVKFRSDSRKSDLAQPKNPACITECERFGIGFGILIKLLEFVYNSSFFHFFRYVFHLFSLILYSIHLYLRLAKYIIGEDY